MKKLFTLVTFLTFAISIFAQDSGNMKLFINDQGNIEFETKYQQQTTVNQLQNWLHSLPESTKGKIEYINAKSGELRYSGNAMIYMSEKSSVFQTQMFFTIHIRRDAHHSVVEIKDIYYKSLPEYGKQGTPSVITYPSDWFADNKLYKKSGKMRWLNQMMKQNTIAKAEELLASGEKFFIP